MSSTSRVKLCYTLNLELKFSGDQKYFFREEALAAVDVEQTMVTAQMVITTEEEIEIEGKLVHTRLKN